MGVFLTLADSASKHEYCGNGQSASDLTRVDHPHAAGDWQPERPCRFAGTGSWPVNFSEFAGSENISRIQDGIHTWHVVDKGFDGIAQVTGLLEAFTDCGFTERLSGLGAAARNFKGRAPSEEPVLANQQDAFFPYCDQAHAESMIVDEHHFFSRAEGYIDSQDGLIPVSILETLLENSGLGHGVDSSVGKIYLQFRTVAGHCGKSSLD